MRDIVNLAFFNMADSSECSNCSLYDMNKGKYFKYFENG